MIWRDDDISAITKLEQFRFVHEIFKGFGLVHTIAVIAKDIEKNKELVDYINDHKKSIDVQLHCWEHYDHKELSEEKLREFFRKGIDSIHNSFGLTPKIFYPPWNSVSGLAIQVAESFNLQTRPQKCSLKNYIDNNGQVSFDVVNFHYWYEPEVNDLYKALKIHIESSPVNR